MRAALKRLSPRETRWFFTTDIFRPERDTGGYIFKTGYFVAHGFGLHLAVYWRR